MTSNLLKNAKTDFRARICIVRPLPFILMFFATGLVACFYLYKYIIWVYIALFILALGLYVFGIINKKLLIACLVALVLSLEGVCYQQIHKSRYIQEGYYSGTGTVLSVNSNGVAVISDATLEGEKIAGNILVFNLDAKAGDYIAFGGKLTNLDLHNSYDLNRIASGTYYKMELSFSRYELTQSYSFKESVLMAIHEGFVRCSNETTADYVMSLMFGRSDMLDFEIRSDFIGLGVAHVFAVSGLHIGVIVAFLTFIAKKLRINRNLFIIALSAFLLVYAYLCSFSPSVLRASIMTVLTLLLLKTKRCPDKASVFSFVAIISLIFKPIWIADIGFLLSYASVLGIFLLFPFLQKPFEHQTKFKKLTSLITINIAVTLSLMPLTMLFFNRFSLMNILAGFIIIPLTSILYLLAFITLPLLMFKFIPKPFGILSNYIVRFNTILASALNKTKVDIKIDFKPIAIPFWYTGLFILSDFVNLDYRKRSIFALSFLSIAFLL